MTVRGGGAGFGRVGGYGRERALAVDIEPEAVQAGHLISGKEMWFAEALGEQVRLGVILAGVGHRVGLLEGGTGDEDAMIGPDHRRALAQDGDDQLGERRGAGHLIGSDGHRAAQAERRFFQHDGDGLVGHAEGGGVGGVGMDDRADIGALAVDAQMGGRFDGRLPATLEDRAIRGEHDDILWAKRLVLRAAGRDADPPALRSRALRLPCVPRTRPLAASFWA